MNYGDLEVNSVFCQVLVSSFYSNADYVITVAEGDVSSDHHDHFAKSPSTFLEPTRSPNSKRVEARVEKEGKGGG